MSASNKKKLRKEQEMSKMTERQRKEAQEAKKLKAYTWTAFAVIVLCVAILVTTVAWNPVKNTLYKNTNAVTVGDHTLNAVELNYFYIDAINEYCNQYSSYLSYILDTSKPLSEQILDTTTGKTWADSFLDSALDNVASIYELCDLAEEDGFTLTEDEKKSVNSTITYLSLYAAYYGYNDAEAYLRAIYGNGATLESYAAYYEKCALAEAYYAHHYDSLEYDDAAIRAYEADKYSTYSSFTYSYYYLAASKFYSSSATDAEKAAAIEECKQVADGLAAGEYADIDAFNAAIKALEINASNTSAACTENENYLGSKVNSLFLEWLGSEERVEGDLTVIENASGTDENKTVIGYYVVRFGSVEHNDMLLTNVRHLLVAFEGGTKDDDGNVTYSDTEKKAAADKAQELLDEWLAGDATEESFAELANKNSDDGDGTTGGLYEDIYPGQMVEEFEDWCFDAERKAGDYEIIETEYGYHIMYFSSYAEHTYRDYLIDIDMRTEDTEQWHSDLIENAGLVLLTDKYVNKDLILS